MKRTAALCVFLGLCQLTAAQVSITPYMGINSTRLYDGFFFQNGGAFPVAGVELELAMRRKPSALFYLSMATGASYLKNGFYNSDNFSYSALDFYTQRITNINTAYLQVPVTLRLHWLPFPLVEDWKIFLGVGVSHNTLMQFTLEEKYTEVTLNPDVLAPPQVVTYEDSRDVMGYGEKSSLFRRIELGMTYKRLQVTYRHSRSLTDPYRTGLENDWNIPDDDSWYIRAYQESGKIIEKHTEVVVGFRFGR